jgi:hypothetical protein
METTEKNTQQSLFEVVLYAEGKSWLFSTCARASKAQEALERAETEFSVHSAHHRLSHKRIEATSAYVFHAMDDHSFTKRGGKWMSASRVF